jgi:hypothetical protein
MTRRSILLCALACACSQQQIPTPERSLNRPMEVAIGCVWGVGPSAAAGGDRYAVPASMCNDNTTTTWCPTCNLNGHLSGPGTRALGFIPNSATGELAVATLAEGDAGFGQLVDLDSHQPGYNFIPVGRLPVAAETTSDGCRVMVVNEGSCDLSSVDVGLVANGADTKTELPGSVFPVQPHLADGTRILAKPRSIAIIPRTDVGVRFDWVKYVEGAPHQGIPACDPNYPYHAFVTYPGCDLVAEIDLATGQYVRGVFFKADGTMTDAGAAPVCPVECSDLGPSTGGTASSPQVQPVALGIDALDPNKPCIDPSTNCPATVDSATFVQRPFALKSLYVGGMTSRFVYKLDISQGGLVPEASVELDSCKRQVTPTTPQVLTCDPVGVTRIRRSPRPQTTGDQSSPGLTIGPFLYTVTLDGTVRVLSVDEFRECETNPDAQMVAARFPGPPGAPLDPYAGARMMGKEACLPLDEAPESQGQIPLRRANANGPGLRVSGGAIDVAFADGSSALAGGTLNITGTFAYVLGSNGAMTVANIQNTGGAVPTEGIPNQIHNRNTEVPGVLPIMGDPSTGAPNVDPSSIRFAIPLDVGIDENSQIPSLAPIARPCMGDSMTIQAAIHFPDPMGPHFENWTMIYESGLPELLRPGGNLGADTPSTMVLLDAGGRFCQRGALPGDFMEFAGCTDNTQCPRGEACFGAFGGQQGLCLAATTDAVGNVSAPPACLDLVNSRHEFRVVSTTNNTLILDEKPLAIPLAGGCTSDADCQNIDLYGAPNASPTHLFKPQRSDGTTKPGFICDPQPWPGTGARQCVLACGPPHDPNQNNDWQPSDDDCLADPAFGGNPLTSGLYVEYTGYVCGHDPVDPAMPNGNRRCVASRVPRDPKYDSDPRVGRNTADECFVVPIAYQVHAGLTFLVQGDRTGYLHNLATAEDGSCVADPSRGVKRIGRLSYNAPRCQYPHDPGQKDDEYLYGDPTGQVDSQGNPVCVWTGTKKVVTPNPCLRLVTPVIGKTMMVWEMENPAFQAEIGPVARLDDQGNIGPPAFGNTYGFSFQVTGGFLPLVSLTNSSVPAVIHAGPSFPGPPNSGHNPWLYIIDSGDQVSPTLGTVLNGQMIRIDPLTLGIDSNTTVQ